MAAPVEFRYYMKKFTMQDLESGLQPVKQMIAPGVVKMFAPPTLQWRYQQKVFVDGKAALEWSEYFDVPYVREPEAAPAP